MESALISNQFMLAQARHIYKRNSGTSLLPIHETAQEALCACLLLIDLSVTNGVFTESMSVSHAVTEGQFWEHREDNSMEKKSQF